MRRLIENGTNYGTHGTDSSTVFISLAASVPPLSSGAALWHTRSHSEIFSAATFYLHRIFEPGFSIL